MRLCTKPESDAAYLQELNEAVASIDTHPTIPAEEVFAWMRTWGTESEIPMPFIDTQTVMLLLP